MLGKAAIKMALLSRPLWSAGALAFPPTNNQRVAEPTHHAAVLCDQVADVLERFVEQLG